MFYFIVFVVVVVTWISNATLVLYVIILASSLVSFFGAPEWKSDFFLKIPCFISACISTYVYCEYKKFNISFPYGHSDILNRPIWDQVESLSFITMIAEIPSHNNSVAIILKTRKKVKEWTHSKSHWERENKYLKGWLIIEQVSRNSLAWKIWN